MTDVIAAEVGLGGQFNWQVTFGVQPYPGTPVARLNGWLVQKVESTLKMAGRTAPAFTARYWEAWQVDYGVVSPTMPGRNGLLNDRFKRPDQGIGTTGEWTMAGTMYFVPQGRPKPLGKMTIGGALEAKDLMSTAEEPPGLGRALASRFVIGTWEADGTHEVEWSTIDAGGFRQSDVTAAPVRARRGGVLEARGAGAPGAAAP